MGRPKGIPMPEWQKEQKRQIMLVNNPNTHPEVRRKISEALRGRSFSEEHRKKIGLSSKGRIPWNKGINNSKKEWYRMLRKSASYYEWRKEIFTQDDYQCQSCGVRTEVGKRVELHPHHIIAVRRNKDLALDIRNGVTLCIECHRGYHMMNGGFQNA